MSLFAVGITMTTETGAVVAAEKVQRKTGRTREAVHDGIKEREDVYETVARIIGTEQLTGEIPEMVAHIAGRLRGEPLLDDTQARIDVSVVGLPALRLFSAHRAYASPVVIGGEKEATDKQGTATLPVQALQKVVTLMLQAERVEFIESLCDGPMLLHSLRDLEALPPTGPARDLGLAAALAVWTAHQCGSSYRWVSRKPDPNAGQESEARRMRHYAIQQAKKKMGISSW